MAHKHGRCVIPTVALVKLRETLPEPEWCPFGGAGEGGGGAYTTLFFFHCLRAMFPLVPSAGSHQETEIHQELTSPFNRANNELPQKGQPSLSQTPFLRRCGSGEGGRDEGAGGWVWPVQMKVRAGAVNHGHTWRPPSELLSGLARFNTVWMLHKL